jgi:2-dehydro-3-deoxyphosphogluconate aldolase/(4S)-4-hydroxy-2-oxoglutarate aldolase
MTRTPLPSEIMESRVVAVMRGLETDRAVDVAAAALAGGVSVFEVTMDSPRADRTIAALVERGHAVGAGTVLSIADAHSAVDSGAQFLVSPHTDDEVLAWAVHGSHPIVPGGYTPSEVAHAWSRGAAAVKLFPASIGGPGLVRAILGPLGGVPLVVTGGIDGSNVAAFLSAGALAAGVGGWLVSAKDLATVKERAEFLKDAALTSDV